MASYLRTANLLDESNEFNFGIEECQNNIPYTRSSITESATNATESQSHSDVRIPVQVSDSEPNTLHRTLTSKYIDYQDCTHPICYEHKQTKESLLKAFMKWLLTTLTLMIASIPMLIIVNIISLILISESLKTLKIRMLKIFKIEMLFIWSLTIMITLYFLCKTNMYEDKIRSFVAIMPLFMVVLFRDAFISGLKIREKIKHLAKIAKMMRITWILNRFAKNYTIWGVSIFAYKPYGAVECHSPDASPKEMKLIMKTVKDQFQNQGQEFWIHKANWPIYNASDRIMSIIMTLLGGMYVILPLLTGMIDNAYEGYNNMKITCNIYQIY